MARVTVFVREDGRAALPRQFQHESDPAQQLYRAVIRGLRPEQAGALELESSDQLSTERARLRQAAKAEGIALVVRSRAARVLYFWRRPAAPSVDIDPADTDLPAFLRDAPWDDEPITPEDEAAIEDGRAALARGDFISQEAMRAELGL
jgi:hypothetical protein